MTKCSVKTRNKGLKSWDLKSKESRISEVTVIKSKGFFNKNSYPVQFGRLCETNIKEGKILYSTKLTALKTEKAYSKVISIDEKNSNAVIELYLPNCEILHELNSYFFNLLKRKNLCYVGSEFYFITIQKNNGLEVLIEPYIEDKTDIEKMYNELEELLDD